MAASDEPTSRFSGKMGMMAAGNVSARRRFSHSKSENRRHTAISLRGKWPSVVLVSTLYRVCLDRPEPYTVGLVTRTRTADDEISATPDRPMSGAVP